MRAMMMVILTAVLTVAWSAEDPAAGQLPVRDLVVANGQGPEERYPASDCSAEQAQQPVLPLIVQVPERVYAESGWRRVPFGGDHRGMAVMVSRARTALLRAIMPADDPAAGEQRNTGVLVNSRVERVFIAPDGHMNLVVSMPREVLATGE